MTEEGTFLDCTNCNKKINCCKSFDKINAPVLNIDEINEISNKYHNFYDTNGKDLYTLKIVDNSCIFYNDNKCSIYDLRPIDCRLYPFDVIKKDNKYFLILYKLECINTKHFLDNVKDIECLVEKIKPWISEFTNETNYSKMKKRQYLIIKEINV